MSPEEIVQAYDTLALPDVYGAIAYILRHREEVETYMKRCADEAAALCAEIEAERPRITREELLALRYCGARQCCGWQVMPTSMAGSSAAFAVASQIWTCGARRTRCPKELRIPMCWNGPQPSNGS